jgi:hypothetical protein
MAIGVQLDFKGATLDQYDEVIRRMGFRPEGAGAPGSIFHCVTPTPDGFRVIDVWATQEAFEDFAVDHIAPMTSEVGVPAPPEVRIFPVHNFLTAG